MEEKLLRCPNCGANATNHQNCEYCGSLLVRFVDKGIDLSQTTYTSNAEVFPGLIQNLQQNLQLQTTTNQDVLTGIYREMGKEDCESDAMGSALLSIVRPGYSTWMNDQIISFGTGENGLCICLSFWSLLDETDEEWIKKENQTQNERLARFESLNSFGLFTPHISYTGDSDDGGAYVFHEYAIDFGNDAEGAARLISEILQKVYLVPLSERLEISTNSGEDIEKSSEMRAKARGVGVVEPAASEGEKINWWAAVVLGFIGFLLLKACS